MHVDVFCPFSRMIISEFSFFLLHSSKFSFVLYATSPKCLAILHCWCIRVGRQDCKEALYYRLSSKATSLLKPFDVSLFRHFFWNWWDFSERTLQPYAGEAHWAASGAECGKLAEVIVLVSQYWAYVCSFHSLQCGILSNLEFLNLHYWHLGPDDYDRAALVV